MITCCVSTLASCLCDEKFKELYCSGIRFINIQSDLRQKQPLFIFTGSETVSVPSLTSAPSPASNVIPTGVPSVTSTTRPMSNPILTSTPSLTRPPSVTSVLSPTSTPSMTPNTRGLSDSSPPAAPHNTVRHTRLSL